MRPTLNFIRMKNIISIFIMAVMFFLLFQSCCNKGNLYHYLDPDDYFAFKAGDTLTYTNENADTVKYIVSESVREIHWMTDQPLDECYKSEYKETAFVSFRNADVPADTFNNFGYGYGFFTIHWNGKQYLDNVYCNKLDSIVLGNFIYRNVFIFCNEPIVKFNYNYGVIQFSDSIQQKWTLINTLKK